MKLTEIVSGLINREGKIFEFEKEECPVNEQTCRNIVNEELTPIRLTVEELSLSSESKSFNVTDFPVNPELGDTVQYWGDNPSYEKGQVYVFQLDDLHPEIFYWKPKFALHESEILPEIESDISNLLPPTAITKSDGSHLASVNVGIESNTPSVELKVGSIGGSSEPESAVITPDNIGNLKLALVDTELSFTMTRANGTATFNKLTNTTLNRFINKIPSGRAWPCLIEVDTVTQSGVIKSFVCGMAMWESQNDDATRQVTLYAGNFLKTETSNDETVYNVVGVKFVISAQDTNNTNWIEPIWENTWGRVEYSLAAFGTGEVTVNNGVIENPNLPTELEPFDPEIGGK